MAEQQPVVRDVDATLRRVVVGWRAFSLFWMAALVIELQVSDDPGDTPIELGILGLAVGWTVVTLWAARNQQLFQSAIWLIADAIVASVVSFGPQAAGTDSHFFGGYPLSFVILVAYTSKAHWLAAGALSAGLMSGIQISAELTGNGDARIAGDVAVFFATAWVMGAGMWALRRNEALRLAAEHELAAEQSRRRRADERNELASRLHDSVLQFIPVIRRRADDPRAVRRLTREVERELRRFLERLRSEHPDGFRAAIREAAWDVEDLYGIVVDVVRVGDCEMTDALQAVVGAAREAMVNAAKHSGERQVDLYSEVADSGVQVFVRDRGSGFTATSASGGIGIAESIVGRLERHNGHAEILSQPGYGTEVRILLSEV